MPLHHDLGSLRSALPLAASPSGYHAPSNLGGACPTRQHEDNPASRVMASTAFHNCRQSPMVLCFLLATITCRQVASATPATSVLFLDFFFAFPSFLRAVKAISTIGFVLTLISVFFAAVVYLWVCYYSCFFAKL